MSVFQHLPADGAESSLHIEEVAVADIVAAVGTPVYVYSRSYFRERYELLTRALATAAGSRPVQVHYAVKANSNLAVLAAFLEAGAGFDIVSGGELSRVMAAGGDPAKVVFSGVGKSVAEIDYALKLGIQCFNLESEAELERLAERARLLSLPAAIAVRVNPDVDAATHPYISTGLKENKFGVPADTAVVMYEAAARDPWLSPTGIACHIGSQIAGPGPMIEALRALLTVVDDLAALGIELDHVDLGGGFGVTYDDEVEFDVADYGRQVAEALEGRPLGLAIEPGRFLVANGGILVTRVEYLKPGAGADEPSFAVVDAAMNDLIRPALYQAWHRVEAVQPGSNGVSRPWDIVGPVCESGDFLARGRTLALAPGDLLAVHSAGAYGMALSSNYNSRPRPAEALVDGERFTVIRRRETTEDLFRLESVGDS